MLDITAGDHVRLACLETDWGWVGTASTSRGLCGLTLPEGSHLDCVAALRRDWPDGLVVDCVPFADFAQQLRRYFRGEAVRFEVALDLPQRPPFWRRVWDEVARIPYGETRSYGQVALLAGSPHAARAVGGAMARNPVPIVVPCHRVVGSWGGLVGFGGGLSMKRRLIDMEREATVGAVLEVGDRSR